MDCLTGAWPRQESLVCQEFDKSFFALLAIRRDLDLGKVSEIIKSTTTNTHLHCSTPNSVTGPPMPCHGPQSRTILPPPGHSETVTSSRPFSLRYATVRSGKPTTRAIPVTSSLPSESPRSAPDELGMLGGAQICLVATRALTAAGGDDTTPPDALGAIVRSAKT